ncbi:uncharacterized protein [Amphiura filiformis]|uniref:uncharacterized protein n=1 Tax=Amphiura filiformis TaxID=82378 RepID=UPI003B219870
MFTIHHQPQLAIWLKEQEKPHKLRAIMEKERNQEFMRLAEEKGYLQTPSKDAILQKSRTKSGRRKASKLAHVGLLNMTALKLMDLGEVGACSRLKVCIMPGNYLTTFDVLANCRELVKLDLHSNQISTLPGPDFWDMLSKLKVVYLHNNSIGRLECLQNMSTSADLQVLTLYDTPISLKKSYRHHVVNSVWTLKALDHYVISDEEIIEDAVFGGHYSTMHPSFKYNPVPFSKKDNTLDDELALVEQVLQSVATIQSKHSPVIIIQRYVRGYLTKKRYRKHQNARIWATVSIQRYWRRYKGLKYVPTSKSSKSRASSSTKKELPLESANMGLPAIAGLPPPRTPPTTSTGLKPDTRGGQRHLLDYDTYLKNRRPGSKSPSVVSSLPGERRADKLANLLDELEENEQSALQKSSPTPEKKSSPVRKRTNLHIDLTKLEADALNMQCSDPAQAVVIENTIGVQESIDSIMKMKPGEKAPEPAQVKRLREKRENHEKRRKKMEMKTVKQMLGRLPEDILERDQEESEEGDEEEPTVKFRISGLKSVFHSGDLFQELVIMKRELGKDMRQSHQDVIDKYEKPRSKAVKPKKPNADQRMFTRVQGTMGMSCLRAVQQAYRDREKAEKRASKQDYVARLREQREEGRRRGHNILEDRRLNAIKQKDIDLNDVADSLEKQVTREQADFESRKQRRSKSHEITKSFHKEVKFSTEFIGQQTSISNALQKHDHSNKFEEKVQGNVAIVQTHRDHQENQSDLVRRYLEHRKLMRQAQVAVERAALDTRMLQEANERMLEVRTRVDKQKLKSQSAKAFFPLPKAATNPVLPPVQLEGKPDKWQTLIGMYDGRVGNHHTLVTT